jgi:hypothetical protein
VTTRAEHIQFCKRRAREYINAGLLDQAVTSMMSDLRNHPETEGMARNAHLGMIGLMDAKAGDRDAVSRFIEGFSE